MTVSCFQIYCEQAYDMLSGLSAGASRLLLRGGQRRMPQLIGLRMRMNNQVLPSLRSLCR